MSNEFKGTPGPWRVDEEGCRVLATDNRSTIICEVVGSMSNPTVAAEARLIAAAPDLLEALVELFTDYKLLADSGDAGNWSLEDLDAGKKAIAAIAKATGEAL